VIEVAVVLRWTKPSRVADWEWRRKKGEFGPLAWRFLRWSLPLALICVCLTHLFAPQHFRRAAMLAIGLPVFFLARLYSDGWVNSRSSNKYEVCETGLRIGPGIPVRYRWRDIEGYRLVDHPELQGIRGLSFKVNRFRRWRTWWFDPSELHEARLRAILEEHLPGKSWDKVPQV
jgi:hypothetical protein